MEDLKKTFYELEKIKQQINLLSDFLAAKIAEQKPEKSSELKEMIDPRTNDIFKRRLKQ